MPAGRIKGRSGFGVRGGSICGTGLLFRSAYQRRSRDRQCAHSRTVRLISGVPHRTHRPCAMRRWSLAFADAHFRSRHGRQIRLPGARPETRLRSGTPGVETPHKIHSPRASRRRSNWRAGCTASWLTVRDRRRGRRRRPGRAGRFRHGFSRKRLMVRSKIRIQATVAAARLQAR